MTDYQLLGKYLLSGQIICVTGLHIGGTTTGVEIGGLDNPVIKDPLSDQPYIPGSGLKGKLRSLTEWSLGLIGEHPKHGGYAAYDCHELEVTPPPGPAEANYARYQKALVVGKLYGAASDNNTVRVASGPSRLTVRDAFLTPDAQTKLQDALGTRLFTEVKTENALDRVTSEANPRPIERVPAGSAFSFTFIVDVYEASDRQLFRELFGAMRLLEHSALGGSGSRGHGQVKFDALELSWRGLDHYRKGHAEKVVALPGAQLEALVKEWDKVAWPA